MLFASDPIGTDRDRFHEFDSNVFAAFPDARMNGSIKPPSIKSVSIKSVSIQADFGSVNRFPAIEWFTDVAVHRNLLGSGIV